MAFNVQAYKQGKKVFEDSFTTPKRAGVQVVDHIFKNKADSIIVKEGKKHVAVIVCSDGTWRAFVGTSELLGISPGVISEVNEPIVEMAPWDTRRDLNAEAKKLAQEILRNAYEAAF